MGKTFRRAEIGVRLSSPAGDDVWAKITGNNSDGMHNDPKYIFECTEGPDAGTQYRTFCCCTDGEIVTSKYNGVYTLSGRSDRKSTGVSNIGFNMRFYEEEYGDLIRYFIWLCRRQIKPFKMSYEDFMNGRVYGTFSGRLKRGLEKFRELYDISKCEVSGPCIEGVGDYWNLDQNLKDLNGRNAWVAGDSTGRFRGLCAALVSGHYIATQIYKTARYGKFLNKVYNDLAYLNDAPELKGTITPALYEIHIFLKVNPTFEEYEKYQKCVEEYNNTRNPPKPMKGCYLALDFTHGEVTVLQSARYFASDNLDEVVNQCHGDARFFSEAGFDVVREKIEVSVHGVQGLPENEEQFKLYGKRYFEFHIRVESKQHPETEELTPEEHADLLSFSKDISQEFGVPVPLSYNKAKSLEGVYQRFLNLRLRDIGVDDALAKVDSFCKLVDEKTRFTVKKRICEYIIYDSYVALDKGWIDF
jgi:hypothetical protein